MEVLTFNSVLIKHCYKDRQKIKKLCVLVYNGDYYRLLTPGQYKVTAYRDGYLPHSRLITVVNEPYTAAQRVDFALKPITVFNSLMCFFVAF